MNDDDEDNEQYEHEYEPERITIKVINENDKEEEDTTHITNTNTNANANNKNISVEVLCVVPPPLEYMSTLHTNQIEISSRKIWCGSIVLAHVLCNYMMKEQESSFFFQNNNNNNNKKTKILELGSGTGLVGMVVSKFLNRKKNNKKNSNNHQNNKPPSCIILSDGDVDAVKLIEQNLSNSFNSNGIDQSITKATHLLWGKDDKEEEDIANNRKFTTWCQTNYKDVFSSHGLNDNNNNETTVTTTTTTTTKTTTKDDNNDNNDDGNNDDVNVKFDVILAADVLYKEELPILFFETIQLYLEEGGILWLCHIPRSTVSHNVVIKAAQEANFCIEPFDNPNNNIWKNDIKQFYDNNDEHCPNDDLERSIVYRVTHK